MDPFHPVFLNGDCTQHHTGKIQFLFRKKTAKKVNVPRDNDSNQLMIIIVLTNCFVLNQQF